MPASNGIPTPLGTEAGVGSVMSGGGIPGRRGYQCLIFTVTVLIRNGTSALQPGHLGRRL